MNLREYVDIIADLNMVIGPENSDLFFCALHMGFRDVFLKFDNSDHLERMQEGLGKRGFRSKVDKDTYEDTFLIVELYK